MFTWIRKILTDLLYKQKSNRLSIGRVAFMATLLVCLYTAVYHREVYDQLVVLLVALLPYLWIDKRIKEAITENLSDTIDTEA